MKHMHPPSVRWHAPALCLAALLGLTWIGCGGGRVPPPPDPASLQQADASDGVDSEGHVADARSNDGPPGDPSPDEAVALADTPPQQPQLESVGPEDARRGSSIRGGGIITEPLRQYFLIQHRIVFDYVKRAEQLYEAEHGQMPKSNEQYMREIIEANQLQLPELDPGWEYFYDASDGQLKRRKTE